MEINLAMFTMYKIIMKQIQILRFVHFNNDF